MGCMFIVVIYVYCYAILFRVLVHKMRTSQSTTEKYANLNI